MSGSSRGDRDAAARAIADLIGALGFDPAAEPELAATTAVLAQLRPGDEVVASADLSAEEQLVLERLNQVRADPRGFVPAWRTMLAGEVQADRRDCREPTDMLDPILGYAPRQPLAASQALTDGARGHGRDMLARAFFAHVNPDGVGPNQRVIAAGYPLPLERPLAGSYAYSAARDAANIESIYERDSSGALHLTAGEWRDVIDSLVIDACVPSRGHRAHVLGAGPLGAVELEVGVGGVTSASSQRVAIEIAPRGDGQRFVLGVAFHDADGDGAYDLGEGQAGVAVELAAAGVATRTGPGGGYALPVADGLRGTITAAGASVPVAIDGANVKVDFRLP